MQFYKAITGAGGNYNRIVIERNKCSYNHATTATMVVGADWRMGSISFNQLEGSATQISASNADGNVFIANSGESSNSTNPFIDFTAFTHSNIVMMGQVSTGDASIGTYIQLGTQTHSNIVIGGSVVGQAGYKYKYIDNATANGLNRFFGSDYGFPGRYVSSAGKTNLADSDFRTAPPNGATGTAHNTTDGKSYLCTRANGTWKSVEVTA
jgi:hypothetical protein